MAVVVTKKTKVRHRNGINETLAEMPLSARRVLFLAMVQLDPKKIVKEGAVFRVSAKDYAEVCDINVDVAYRQLKEAAEQLQRQVISIPKSELLEPIARIGERPWVRPVGTGVRMLNITEWCDYEEGNGYIEVSFTRQMEPYICKLERDYTTQVLLSSVRLTENNASRLYQYLRNKISNGKTSYFDIEIDKLKKDLGADQQDTYAEFKYFKRAYFKTAVDQIIKKTEFKSIEIMVAERVKRKISKVRIFYTYENY